MNFFIKYFIVQSSERISTFYTDVDNLGLRFPVAELAKKLHFSKGYVSDVLNKKKEPSEDFIQTFYKKFSNSSQSSTENDNYALPMGGVQLTLQDYLNMQEQRITELRRDKDLLYQMLNSTLGQIHSDQQVAIAYQKAWVEYEAERVSEGDESKKKKIMYKMGKLVDGKLKGKPLEGSPGETRR